jgi:hypothetical protein
MKKGRVKSMKKLYHFSAVLRSVVLMGGSVHAEPKKVNLSVDEKNV